VAIGVTLLVMAAATPIPVAALEMAVRRHLCGEGVRLAKCAKPLTWKLPSHQRGGLLEGRYPGEAAMVRRPTTWALTARGGRLHLGALSGASQRRKPPGFSPPSAAGAKRRDAGDRPEPIYTPILRPARSRRSSISSCRWKG